MGQEQSSKSINRIKTILSAFHPNEVDMAVNLLREEETKARDDQLKEYGWYPLEQPKEMPRDFQQILSSNGYLKKSKIVELPQGLDILTVGKRKYVNTSAYTDLYDAKTGKLVSTHKAYEKLKRSQQKIDEHRTKKREEKKIKKFSNHDVKCPICGSVAFASDICPSCEKGTSGLTEMWVCGVDDSHVFYTDYVEE